MKSYKFTDVTISWFSSYLADKYNKVEIQNMESSTIPVGNFGTTQGLVLGGILYTIYSSDLPANKSGNLPTIMTTMLTSAMLRPLLTCSSESRRKLMQQVHGLKLMVWLLAEINLN